MPKPYPKEFRDDVVRVALNREPGVRIKDIAITESCLGNWLAQAARDEGRRPGSTTTELVELREAKKRPFPMLRGGPLWCPKSPRV